jgi:hypothetical protein
MAGRDMAARDLDVDCAWTAIRPEKATTAVATPTAANLPPRILDPPVVSCLSRMSLPPICLVHASGPRRGLDDVEADNFSSVE